MKLSKIHHVAIIGSDYHLSKDFYVISWVFLLSVKIIARSVTIGK